MVFVFAVVIGILAFLCFGGPGGDIGPSRRY
jgi:hypothetical protein